MPQYTYHALSAEGDAVTSEISAENVSAAIAAIQARGLTVESIALVSRPRATTPHRNLEHSALDLPFDVVLERRRILIPALEALTSEMPDGRSRTELRQLIKVLDRARTVSELRHSPKVVHWLPLLATGFSAESSTRRLSDLIAHASRESQNRSQRRRLLAYPILVSLIALGVFGFLCVMVVPTFSSMFRDFGLRLSTATQLLVFVSDQLVQHPIRFVVIVVLIAVAIYGLLRLWVHFAMTTRLLGPWVAGNSASVSAMSSLTNQLAELLSIDMSLSDALWIAGQGCKHYHFKTVAENLARDAHHATQPLSESPNARYLPANVVYALQANFDGGPNLTLLRELSAIYAERAGRRVDWSSGAAAQFAIVVVGIAIAFVIIALFSPLVSVVSLS